MCLACQHFDFNSADWISDNLHVITSWYFCKKWERNLSFGSADVRGTGTGDEPLRTSVWEAKESHPHPKSLATTSKMWQLLAQRTSCNSSFFFPALSSQWSSPCSCDSYKAWTPSGIMTAIEVQCLPKDQHQVCLSSAIVSVEDNRKNKQ